VQAIEQILNCPAASLANLFFSSGWADAVRATMPDVMTRYDVENEGHIAASIVAVRNGGQVESHSLVPYNGPWVSKREDGFAALSALALRIRNECRSAKLDLRPGWSDLDPFVRSGWLAEQRFTFVSDLTSDVDRAAAPAVRRRARIAASAGVEFDALVAPADFVDIWRRNCIRRNIGVFLDPEALTALLARIVIDGMGEILGARLPDGRLAAANAILYDDDFAYFWLSGFDPQEPHRGASNQLCHLRTLRRAGQRVDRFDWLGANTPGVTEYKASFGPSRVGYFRLRYASNRTQTRPWWNGLLGPLRRKLTGPNKDHEP
jgi:GNAT acetyltransferase-like protein